MNAIAARGYAWKRQSLEIDPHPHRLGGGGVVVDGCRTLQHTAAMSEDATPAAKPLNDRHQAFVEQYLIDLNATRAYCDVYGVEAKIGSPNGTRLLRNARIAAEISRRQQERSKRTGITADRVLEELAAIAFSDLRNVVTWGGEGEAVHVTPIPSAEIAEAPARAVQRIKARVRTVSGEDTSETTVETEVVLHDKLGALTLIARHLGMLKDKSSLEAGPGLVELLALAAKHQAPAAPPLP